MPQTDTKVESLTDKQIADLAFAKMEADKASKVSFGDGRYSPVMNELYKDSIRLLQLTQKQAERLARAYGAELGKLQMQNKISFGRVTKNQQVTIREIASIKGVTMTHTLNLAKACVVLQDSLNFGIDSIIEVKLRDNVLEWLNKE